jgi:hypothetical protein
VQQQRQQQYEWQPDAAAGFADEEEFSFWTGQDVAAAADVANAAAAQSADGAAGSGSPPIRSAFLAAARQKLAGRARAISAGRAASPGGWSGMSNQEVQRVELAVQQQLQEQQQHEDDGR